MLNDRKGFLAKKTSAATRRVRNAIGLARIGEWVGLSVLRDHAHFDVSRAGCCSRESQSSSLPGGELPRQVVSRIHVSAPHDLFRNRLPL
jgi:hypothetical protein